MDIALQQAAEMIKAHERILIITHQNPDGDTIGSGFGLLYALRQLGKQAKVICSDALPQKFQYFYCRQTDFEPDLIVSVDVADKMLLGKYEGWYNRIHLCLDHHKINKMDAPCRYVDAGASATCEVIYQLSQLLGVKVDKVMANALYTGICTDSGCFQFSNTTATTHRIAADLMEAGADAEWINRKMFGTKSKARILVEREVLETMDFALEDTVAFAVVTQKMMNDTGILPEELDGVAAMPRQIEGVEVGVTFRQREDGSYKVSLRTVEKVDASAVCQNFGGGGHARAAGCVFTCTLAEAKQALLEKIVDYLN